MAKYNTVKLLVEKGKLIDLNQKVTQFRNISMSPTLSTFTMEANQKKYMLDKRNILFKEMPSIIMVKRRSFWMQSLMKL